MSIPVTQAADAEQSRQEKVAELAASEGPAWSEKWRPGTFGCHELLDRTILLAELVESRLLDHPACVANPDWYALAEQAVAALNDLYQRIGAEHLTAENPPNGS